MAEVISGIYCIENLVNGKKYIGKSKNLGTRFRKHKEILNKNIHYNKHLQNSWNKYKESFFIFVILETCDEEVLNEREIYYIKELKTKHPNGYNLTDGGDGGNNIEFTDERKQQISERMLGDGNHFFGKHHTEETKNILSKNRIGTHLSDETKQKIKNFPHKKGKEHHNFGRKSTDETKEKLRIAFSGDKNPMFGKTHSLEIREKISKIHKGKIGERADKKYNGNSIYHGVCFIKNQNTYYVQIGLNGKNIIIGRDKDEILAARLYDFYVIKNNIERTLNFPNDTEKTIEIFGKIKKGKSHYNTSIFYGVSYHKKLNKWQSGTSVNGKNKYIGIYIIEEDAARAYDKYVVENKLNKPLNFPEDYI